MQTTAHNVGRRSAGGERPRAAGEPSAVFYGWKIVGGAFLIYFVAGGLFNTGTVYFKALAAEFGLKRGELSGAFSLGFLVVGMAAPIWGRIADRRGPRAAFVPGVVLTGLLCMALSRIWNLASLYALYVAFTFSSAGISLIPISVVISNWFVTKRGRAIGLAYTGVGFGNMVLVPLVGRLITSIGWRSTYILSGLAVLVLLTPVAVWMKNRPQDLGLLPDGLDPAARPVADAPGHVAKRVAEAGFTLGEAMHSGAFWMIALTWLLTMMPLAAVNLHQVPYMTDIGLSTESAALVAGAIGGLSILGRIGVGLLSERHSARMIYVWCYLLMAVGISALWAAARVGAPALAVYVTCFGIAVGGSFALSALLVGDLFGVRALGEIFGLLGLAATIGGAVGGTGAGVLFDQAGSYSTVFALSIALALSGAAMMLLVPRPVRAGSGTLM